MTLVYGCATEDIAFIVADTLLSFEHNFLGHKRQIDELHALKVQILNPDTAVSFAGDVKTAFEIIQRLQVKSNESPSIDVASYLFEEYLQLSTKAGKTLPDCEFLTLQLTAQGKKLAHVTTKGIQYRDRAYIGDSAEYKRMMALRQPYNPSPTQFVQQPNGSFLELPLTLSKGEIEFAEISDAMTRLVNLRKSETVGAIAGNVTRVVTARISKKLEYMQEKMVSVSAEEGRSGFSLLASNSDKVGIAVYYLSGKLGFLFIVGDIELCRKEYADTEEHFIELAKKKYGLTLT
jgi:hypothetical protein